MVPERLKHGPFTVAEAEAAGVSQRQLQGLAWRRVRHGVYAWAGAPVDTVADLALQIRDLPSTAVYSVGTATWVHALEGRLASPVEVTVPPADKISARAGIRVHCAELGPGDVTRHRGLPVTSISRTIFDAALHLALIDAVVLADTALHSGLVRLRELRRYAGRMEGRKGSRRFFSVLELAEPASESPMESRTRLILVQAGLPRPEVQVKLRDRLGRILARADLYYPERRLCIEFDGQVHRDSLVDDNRRQNRLLNAGYTLLRFTGADVLSRPQAVVAEVRAALR